MIEFRTLGGLDVHDSDGRELRGIFSAPKGAALLTYLAIATPRGIHRRDTLLALFWPELDYERARRALRQALYKIRRSVTDGSMVSPGDGEVGLDRIGRPTTLRSLPLVTGRRVSPTKRQATD